MLKTPLENDVTEYYRSVYRSVIDAEMDTLDAVFDDGFTFTGLSGDESDKKKFLDNIADESINVFSENVERIYVKKDGDILNDALTGNAEPCRELAARDGGVFGNQDADDFVASVFRFHKMTPL